MADFSKGKRKLWPILGIRPKNIRPKIGPKRPPMGQVDLPSAHRRPFSSLLYFCTNLEKNHYKSLLHLLIFCHLIRYFINLLYDLFGHIFYGLMNFSTLYFRPYIFSAFLFSTIKSKPGFFIFETLFLGSGQVKYCPMSEK